MIETKTIAETNRFIVLDRYEKDATRAESYQSEDALERELIKDLEQLGYAFERELNTPTKLLANARTQLQTLNRVQFTESEWRRFVETYLDRPSDGIVEKTRKIHDNYIHDFVFDDGHIQNIYLLDKKNVLRNTCQVIRQFEQSGSQANRYDVTILVNGLPLVQVELKRRGVAIREAFNQIHRYSKESFNSELSLFKFLQLFVITNGTDTRYFANTTQRNKNSFDFTMHWATRDNSLIKDLKDFTATFFEKRTLLKVLLHYSVFDVSDALLVTTASVFGRELHAYVITDAIRDEKVLKFKVDYNDVRPRFKAIETEQDPDKLKAAENRQALLHPDRIKEIGQYILNNYRQKTHRLQAGGKGFNAIFAVSSVDAAKLYYETFKTLQSESERPFKVATIFSFAANEEQEAIGTIPDESFEVSAMNSSAKEFLNAAIADYNAFFKTNFGVDSNGFQNYYRDLAQRVKRQEVDLLIVVGMFLTGFDAPTLNTMFVDKNLRYHGLIQAYSRTNRIYDATKTFGNIITFRDLEQATIDAITLFGDANTKNVVLEKSYKEYMEGFIEVATGEARRGFVEVVAELKERFPDPVAIEKEADKKAFSKLFGEYLKIENALQNFDEFVNLKAWQQVDPQDETAVEAFKAQCYLTDNDLEKLKATEVLPERKVQDYRSTYNDIRDWLRREKDGKEKEKSTVDWDDVVFEIDLLKSQEINLDYILELIFEKNQKLKDKGALIEDVRRVIRASIGNRAKESLVVDFINQADLDLFRDKASIIEAFFAYAQAEQKREADTLIQSESLNEQAAKRYLLTSLKREYASENGTELNSILPKMSPLNPKYITLKQRVFQRIAAFVEKFKGVGGEI